MTVKTGPDMTEAEKRKTQASGMVEYIESVLLHHVNTGDRLDWSITVHNVLWADCLSENFVCSYHSLLHLF